MSDKIHCPECGKMHDASWELGAFCSEKCRDISRMRTDMTTDTNDGVECPYCGKVNTSIIDDDLEEVYGEEKRCRFCEQVFVWEKEVRIYVDMIAYPTKEYLENKYKEVCDDK